MTDLLCVLFAQEAEFHPNPEKHRRGLALLLDDPANADLIVAERDGQVLGMVCLLYQISTALGARVALLEDFVVAPQARGAGIGAALMDFALARGRERGCARVTLLTDANNEKARRFYAARGFQGSPMIPMRRLF